MTLSDIAATYHTDVNSLSSKLAQNKLWFSDPSEELSANEVSLIQEVIGSINGYSPLTQTDGYSSSNSASQYPPQQQREPQYDSRKNSHKKREEQYSSPQYNNQQQYSSSQYNNKQQYSSPQNNNQQQYSSSQYNNQQQYSSSQYNNQQQYSSSQYNNQQQYSSSQYNNQQQYSSPQYNNQQQYSSPQYNNQQQYSSPQYNNQQFSSYNFKPVRRKRKGKATAFLIVLLLCLIGFGVGLYFYNPHYYDFFLDWYKSHSKSTQSETVSNITPLQLSNIEEADNYKHDSIGDSKKALDFSWKCECGNWTYTVYIPESYYMYYKDKPRFEIKSANLVKYVDDKTDDEWIKSFTKCFVDSGKKKGYNENQIKDLVISYVQNLQYQDDKEYTGCEEYPKYPVETIYDQGGDCEDTSILLASMLKEMNYDVVLILLPGHLAVGIADESKTDGNYIEDNGKKYYYIETTDKDWPVGKLPDDLSEKFKKASALKLSY